MRTPIRWLALLSLILAAGCGGGGGGGTPGPIGEVTLRSLTSRSYTVVDLGTLSYYWPGWFLSPGASSISLDNHGNVVSAMNYTPLLWTSSGVSTLTGNFAAARAINDSGQIIGDTWTDQSYWPRHAAIWQKGAITDLGSLSDDPNLYDRYSYAFGINNAGQVVGESSVPVTGSNSNWWTTHPFIYSGGKMTDMGTLGGYYARAVAVNNSGVAVGYGTTTNNDQTHAFIWQNGTISDLGTYPGGAYSQANAINDNGQVVGFATKVRTDLFGSPPPRATLWQNGQLTDLGTLGGPGAYATGINNAGMVIGSAETSEQRPSDLYYFGYYYDYFNYFGYGWSVGGSGAGVSNPAGGGLASGGSNASGTPNVPPAPGGGGNTAGSTYGNSGTGFAGGGSGRAAKTRASGDQRSYFVAHAFAYADGSMFDLNKLLAAGSGWELTQTTAINSLGQIVGVGTYQGQLHGFLLNPQ